MAFMHCQCSAAAIPATWLPTRKAVIGQFCEVVPGSEHIPKVHGHLAHFFAAHLRGKLLVAAAPCGPPCRDVHSTAYGKHVSTTWIMAARHQVFHHVALHMLLQACLTSGIPAE